MSTVIQGKYLHTFLKHTLKISITFVDIRSSNPPHLRKEKPHTPHLPASAHPSQQTGRSRVGQLRSKQMSFVIIEQKAVQMKSKRLPSIKLVSLRSNMSLSENRIISPITNLRTFYTNKIFGQSNVFLSGNVNN